MRNPLIRSILELRTSIPSGRLSSLSVARPLLPPIGRARSFNSTAQIIEPVTTPPELGVRDAAKSGRQPSSSAAAAPIAATRIEATKRSKTAAVPSPSSPSSPALAAPVSTHGSIAAMLPLLASQPSHYVTIHIHGKPYLVTPGDSIRLPFKMHGVLPGDVLRLDRASILGSRDYTLKGSPWISQAFFECRAVVMGTETEPMRLKIKKKRRTRRSQTVRSKHNYTVLRVSELKIIVPES